MLVRNVPPTETTAMVWPHVRKEGEDNTKNMLYIICRGKGKGSKKKRWIDNIREDMKEYRKTEDMTENRSVAHEDIGRPI